MSTYYKYSVTLLTEIHLIAKSRVISTDKLHSKYPDRAPGRGRGPVHAVAIGSTALDRAPTAKIEITSTTVGETRTDRGTLHSVQCCRDVSESVKVQLIFLTSSHLPNC